MSHDPLCPQATTMDGPWFAGGCGLCRLIARVREDERTYAKQTSTAIMAYDEGRKDGRTAALRDAVEAVKLSCSADIELVERTEVIAAIEDLGGER